MTSAIHSIHSDQSNQKGQIGNSNASNFTLVANFATNKSCHSVSQEETEKFEWKIHNKDECSLCNNSLFPSQ